MILLYTVWALLGLANASSYGRKHVTLDVVSGGYSDISVLVSPQLDRKDCPQILDNVKVSFLALLSAPNPSIIVIQHGNLPTKAHFDRIGMS